ncbi:efflux pump [Apiospora phragmitis]|uniref:Efflux pump n=1 Tax=Apiospora phragmitis TaxID=2905665 RepID=A0ABR1UVV4_9PEZI
MKSDNATSMNPKPITANNSDPIAASTKDITDPFLVTFDGPLGPEDPKNWPKGKKWAVTDVLSATGFNRILISTIMAPALGYIAAELRMSSAAGRSPCYLLIPILGSAVGPIVGGFMVGRTTWPSWSPSPSSPSGRPTGPTILERRAARLRRQTGDDRYYTVLGCRDAQKHVGRVLTRALLGAISAFQYGLLYIVLSTFSELWTKQYGHRLMDYMYHYMQQRLGRAEHSSELRVPLSYPGTVLGPLALFLCGWAAQHRLYWAVVDAGVFFALFGTQLQGLPLQAYLMDAYPEHTTSALAATQFLRSLTAFLFPLFALAMYGALGYAWGNSLLAFVALGFGVPAPLLLWHYGKRLREKASSSY